MFYANFVKACNAIQKAPSAVAIDIGISKATVTGWKKGSTPNDSTVQKLADYFGIQTQDLMRDDSKKVKISDGSELSKDALWVAAAYDAADDRTQEIVRLTLEPFGKSGADEAAM